MYSYALLEKGCYYLVQEEEGSSIVLIRVILDSDHCMFISRYGETEETQHWKRKTDTIFEIVELLDDKMVKEWEASYFNSEGAYYEDEE